MLRCVLAILVGLALAEGFLQLAVGRVRDMGLWFTPGIHAPDTRFGFVFTPGYRGLMRHRDRLFAEALTLDERGYRQPVAGPSEGTARNHVVFVGGASMMFGFGLPDALSVPGQVARASRHAVVAENRAWPGQSLHGSWVAWRALEADREPPDVVVVSLFFVHQAPLQVSADDDPPGASRQRIAQLFRFLPDLVPTPRGPVTEWVGPPAFRWLLIHQLARAADPSWAGAALEALTARDPVAAGGAARQANPVREPETIPLRQFFDSMAGELQREGTDLLFVTLPRGRAPADYYDEFLAEVPPGFPSVDLHRGFVDDEVAVQTFAAGHYAPATAEALGARLAHPLDALLDRRASEAPMESTHP